jgi:NAD(P)-dependent dehydrogenase (short-subunit alcohol dehydrogenase family)
VEEICAAGGEARFLSLDLGDLASVRRAASELLDGGDPLHVLVNNAGLAGQRGTTRDGFELIFGTNHLGPYLLTRLLLPRLRETASRAGGARIVNVSSDSHDKARGFDWDAARRPTATVSGMPEYERSKLANVVFTKELARGHAGAGVHSYALHPGVVATDVWRGVPWPVRPIMKLFMISNEEGAKTTLHCATSPEVADHDGRYYANEREKAPNRVAEDLALGQELWARSEELVGGFL